jgi:AcrR family transcriptional regulator
MPNINISVDINENLYIRNPIETKLGKKIIFNSIALFDEIGFEDFNFKRLAKNMESTEASVYRYFENKYKLLSYLVSWYWDYIHFVLIMDIRNVSDPKLKIDVIVNTLVDISSVSSTPQYIDIRKLHNIVVENASKVNHDKRVDVYNKDGFYANLKKLVEKISQIILEIDPQFKYPKALSTNIIELALNSEYYIEHLPRLTDIKKLDTLNSTKETKEMIKYMLSRILND